MQVKSTQGVAPKKVSKTATKPVLNAATNGKDEAIYLLRKERKKSYDEKEIKEYMKKKKIEMVGTMKDEKKVKEESQVRKSQLLKELDRYVHQQFKLGKLKPLPSVTKKKKKMTKKKTTKSGTDDIKEVPYSTLSENTMTALDNSKHIPAGRNVEQINLKEIQEEVSQQMRRLQEENMRVQIEFEMKNQGLRERIEDLIKQNEYNQTQNKKLIDVMIALTAEKQQNNERIQQMEKDIARHIENHNQGIAKLQEQFNFQIKEVQLQIEKIANKSYECLQLQSGEEYKKLNENLQMQLEEECKNLMLIQGQFKVQLQEEQKQQLDKHIQQMEKDIAKCTESNKNDIIKFQEQFNLQLKEIHQQIEEERKNIKTIQANIEVPLQKEQEHHNNERIQQMENDIAGYKESHKHEITGLKEQFNLQIKEVQVRLEEQPKYLKLVHNKELEQIKVQLQEEQKQQIYECIQQMEKDIAKCTENNKNQVMKLQEQSNLQLKEIQLQLEEECRNHYERFQLHFEQECKHLKPIQQQFREELQEKQKQQNSKLIQQIQEDIARYKESQKYEITRIEEHFNGQIKEIRDQIEEEQKTQKLIQENLKEKQLQGQQSQCTNERIQQIEEDIGRYKENYNYEIIRLEEHFNDQIKEIQLQIKEEQKIQKLMQENLKEKQMQGQQNQQTYEIIQQIEKDIARYTENHRHEIIRLQEQFNLQLNELKLQDEKEPKNVNEDFQIQNEEEDKNMKVIQANIKAQLQEEEEKLILKEHRATENLQQEHDLEKEGAQLKAKQLLQEIEAREIKETPKQTNKDCILSITKEFMGKAGIMREPATHIESINVAILEEANSLTESKEHVILNQMVYDYLNQLIFNYNMKVAEKEDEADVNYLSNPYQGFIFNQKKYLSRKRTNPGLKKSNNQELSLEEYINKELERCLKFASSSNFLDFALMEMKDYLASSPVNVSQRKSDTWSGIEEAKEKVKFELCDDILDELLEKTVDTLTNM